MHLKSIPTCLFSALTLLSVTSFSQNRNALVGSWERISMKAADGAVLQPPALPSFLIFSADGYFSQTAVLGARGPAGKPLNEMTKEELLKHFAGVAFRHGTYSVSGNRLTRKNLSGIGGGGAAGDAVQEFRIEGDTMILTGVAPPAATKKGAPKGPVEVRFRRAKPVS